MKGKITVLCNVYRKVKTRLKISRKWIYIVVKLFCCNIRNLSMIWRRGKTEGERKFIILYKYGYERACKKQWRGRPRIVEFLKGCWPNKRPWIPWFTLNATLFVFKRRRKKIKYVENLSVCLGVEWNLIKEYKKHSWETRKREARRVWYTQTNYANINA